jgi:glycosyltransferase involved in cell wall biosynthesis
MGETKSPGAGLRVLMSAGVPRRREGGVAAIIYNLGRELEKRGHQITYVFQEDLVTPGTVAQRWNETIFALRLAKYIIKNCEKFDVVNLHAPVGFVYGTRRRWNRHAGYPPYVMTLHGLEERRVHVMSREEKKGRAWNYSWKNRMWHKYFHQPRFRRAILTADGAHAYSRDVWTLLQLKYNLDAERTAYIPNGVEERFFLPREYRAGSAIRMLYAGSWLDQRGIFYIREAMEKVVAQAPGVKLTIAGGGVPAEVIEKFFGERLRGNIEVREVVPAEKMQELYAEHDALLFPSLMEGLPSVLLEAMAAGIPVITAETCGMTDVVESGFNGLLVPPADAEAMERAILELANSEERRKELGLAAQQTMRRYTWEHSASELEILMRRVIALEK